MRYDDTKTADSPVSFPDLRQHAFWCSVCAVFVASSVFCAWWGSLMFRDYDPFWHIAAGDWIRSHSAIPAVDPWSFSAGTYRWFNISWSWDILFSLIHDKYGWAGAVACNAMIIGLCCALVYAASFAACGDGDASLLTSIFVLEMNPLLLRPLQVTNLMAAAWILILGMVCRGQARPACLFLLPLLMLVWVNMHGGFIVGFVLLGGFFLQAFISNRRQSMVIAAVSVLCLGAVFLNPYGFGIIEAVHRALATSANAVAVEWMPFSTSFTNLLTNFYVVLFILLVLHRPLPLHPLERWLAYFWLLAGLSSQRMLPIFTAVSAPAFACSLRDFLKRYPARPRSAGITAFCQGVTALCSRRSTLVASVLATLVFSLWLPTPVAMRLIAPKGFTLPTLQSEEAFIEQHHPHARILNYYDLGDILAFETQGKIKTFMDGRTETAYPSQVMKDYLAFEYARPGWEKILDRYAIDGVLLPSDTAKTLSPRPIITSRFTTRRGWHLEFSGPETTLFIRDQPYAP